jgi:hypothetical protein
MSGHFTQLQGERINTIEPSASTIYTLSTSQSGSIIFLDHSKLDNGCIIKLPPPDYGLNFKFIVTNNTSSENKVNIQSVNSVYANTNLMYVSTLVDGLNLSTTLRYKLEIDFDTIHVSDMIDFFCNGTNWYVNGHVSQTSKYVSFSLS